MDAREFDFVDPDQVPEGTVKFLEQKATNPMESAFHVGWREWFEAMKTCVVVVKRP